MTTGAILPVDPAIVEDLVEYLPKRVATSTVGQFRQLSRPSQGSQLPIN